MTKSEGETKQVSCSKSKRNIRLLNASIDDEAESHLRILVDDRVKYITIDAGLYNSDDLAFGPNLSSILPAFPEGDWNACHISRDPKTSQPHIQTTKRKFRGISHIWHPFKVDHLDLQKEATILTNVYEVTHERLRVPVIAKFAAFEWEIGSYDNETMIYRLLQSRNIGPRFLGHITEEGRVIGFLIEKIANCRHATPEDLGACGDALKILHHAGIRHGDINKYNFLIHRGSGKPTLIDFECAEKCSDQDILQKEFEELQTALCDTSGIGGIIDLED